ncbi:MAG: hypothetical protein AAF624_09505 [Bacteroidota bacterium]
MHNFEEFIEHVRKRPGMYLGNESKRYLYGLEYLILGINVAEHMYGLPAEEAVPMSGYNGFERWIEKNKLPKQRSINSFGKAAWEADSNEAAFDLWFAWWDELQRERAQHAEAEG